MPLDDIRTVRGSREHRAVEVYGDDTRLYTSLHIGRVLIETGELTRFSGSQRIVTDLGQHGGCLVMHVEVAEEAKHRAVTLSCAIPT